MKGSTRNMSVLALMMGIAISYSTKMQVAELKNNQPITQPNIEQQEPEKPSPENLSVPENEEWREYNGGEYQAIIEKAKKDNKEIILFFTADWCTACKSLKSGSMKSENVKKELLNYYLIVIDTDDYQELTGRYKITSIPTLIKIKANEKQVGKSLVGNQRESELLKWISAK